jgi:hypothetical protein
MLYKLRTYSVQAAARKPLVDFMIDGLRAAGCRLLFSSDTSQAPFVMTFETAGGERLGLVAYAFLATRTPTKHRPSDERSFQIKYGSKETNNLHELWQDPHGLYTTLLIGIDPKEGFFVAADPAMHNPTKFFIRLEFKDRHVQEIKRCGWHAWERERRSASSFPEPVEVLVGGTRDAFLDLVRFERAARGLSQGDRQLLAEKPGLFAHPKPASAESGGFPVPEVVHPIAKELALEPDQILELIANARRLKMAVRGWVAEEHLRNTLAAVPGVSHCERLDQEGGPDLRISYRHGPLLTVECKNVLRKVHTDGLPRIDFQRTRASKADPCSRYYSPTDFDVVAGCLHAVTERWEFRYILPERLASHKTCKGKLASNVRVDSLWTSEPASAFEAAYARIGNGRLARGRQP